MLNYYGIDWLANIFFFVYVYLLTSNPKLSMIMAILGCAAQIVFSIMANSPANAICTAVFAGMYARAYLFWSKNG